MSDGASVFQSGKRGGTVNPAEPSLGEGLTASPFYLRPKNYTKAETIASAIGLDGHTVPRRYSDLQRKSPDRFRPGLETGTSLQGSHPGRAGGSAREKKVVGPAPSGKTHLPTASQPVQGVRLRQQPVARSILCGPDVLSGWRSPPNQPKSGQRRATDDPVPAAARRR